MSSVPGYNYTLSLVLSNAAPLLEGKGDQVTYLAVNVEVCNKITGNGAGCHV